MTQMLGEKSNCAAGDERKRRRRVRHRMARAECVIPFFDLPESRSTERQAAQQLGFLDRNGLVGVTMDDQPRNGYTARRSSNIELCFAERLELVEDRGTKAHVLPC